MTPKGVQCQPDCTCRRHHQSPEQLARLRSMAGNSLGRKHTDEQRRRASEARMGVPLSEEHRRKIAENNADPEFIKRRVASRKARRKTPETHEAVHKRLVSDRGPARTHLCIDCGKQAAHWSHNWPTWEDTAQGLYRGRATFSTNLDAYVPRCAPCHRYFDNSPAAWDFGGGRKEHKLTEADVIRIRSNSGLTDAALARELGVDKSTVRRVRIGTTWKYLLPNRVDDAMG